MSLDDRDYMRAGPPSLGGWLRGLTAFHAVFILNLGVFFTQWVMRIGWLVDPLSGREIIPLGGVSLDGLARGEFWTPFTYMFVHGSLAHVLLNMMLLWFAGRRVQDLYGQRSFIVIYLLSGLVGAALEMTVAAYFLDSTQISLIGASASCMGLLLAYAVAMPEDEISVLLFFIIPVRARLWTLSMVLLLVNGVLGGLALLTTLPAWLSGDGGQVAYFAHVGGALAGWYFARTLGYGGMPKNLLRDERRQSYRRRSPVGARAGVRLPIVDVDVDEAQRQNPLNDPTIDIMRDEVDPILDKVNEHGLHSLTDAELSILKKASHRLGKL